ncbi:MAG TPA: hypothetical protein VFK05_22110 [Polyangiaceae bacterium]|nr:hypothetical protein [Polyangiaceae bacterium]
MRRVSLVSGLQGLALALSLGLGACTPSAGSSDEPLESTQAPVFVNGGFETGGAGSVPSSWTVQPYLNKGITVQTPQTRAGLKLQTGGTALTTQWSGTNQSDPDLGPAASLRYCRYGAQCAVVNFHSSSDYNHGQNVNSLSQSMTIGASDVDPSDGQVHIRFTLAPVLQNPGHPGDQQPYYLVQVTNTTKGILLYSDFNLSAQAGVPWKTIKGGTPDEIDYVDWALVDVAPGAAALAQGDNVTLEIIAAGCSLGGHYGEVYVDGVGTTIPGLFVSGVGPAQTNAGSVVTYDMSYKNGSSAAETGVVINFTTPPGTTFQSLTPPVNATCTKPAVGSAGTITCTVAGSVAAGGSGTFQVSVNLAASATGSLVCGLYDIHSDQETPLNGAKIVTTIGCSKDSDCAAGKWCNIAANQCTATLANGVAIPSDTLHTAPTLNGTCTAAAGSLVCQSAVCETIDNKCGKLNGSGTCTVANQATICRSGVCDADGACGYATDHGPCTTANAGTVCRSGLCSANLLCKPAGGCNVDADCSGGQWCNETAHTCTAKLTNGTNLPTDAPHTSPTLNGTCSAAAATLVCQAGVCETSDNKCGYLINSGPCSAANAGTVCRSGACSANLLCRPAGGCNVDADCASGQWCNESNHVCTAKLSNGTSIPSDPPHSNPALNGSCTVPAATLVCQSAVCDATDNKCGKLNGSSGCTVSNQATVCRSGVCDADGACGYDTNHGPCTAANAGTVCRSGVCSANLLCQPAGGCNVDSDCSAGQWCNETSHTCSLKLTNGTSIPTDAPHTNPTLNGACTTAAATLVCQSSVCDATDDKCGYAVDSGPCTASNAATVCRSGSCSANLLCRPAAGCNVDADCTGGNWCNETLHACTPTLANNSVMPSDAPHKSPTLDGVCSSAAAALVCQSSVCDSGDNRCGYDAGHGPCTTADAGVVCRSGMCGADGLCRLAGGCNVDADCASGNWCEESSHSCKPTLANGSPIPTDAPHVSPTLDGSCSASAAALVCQSAVCDSADDQCGYAAGHGPCTAENGGVVCRSGACSANGLCQPADGCNVDADCAAGKWCNISSGACLPRLGNGTAIPSDPPHTGPVLDGACSEPAATLVCASGICDSRDDRCGLANGTGPCTAADAGSVCRSGHCGSNGVAEGTCVACTKDAHCSGDTPVCDVAAGRCVQCSSSADCGGRQPICDREHSLCVECDGDKGSSASNPCPSAAAPFCVLKGADAGSCGKCAADADCKGHLGNVCDPESGLCQSGCSVDTDCASSEWCNENQHMCTPKLENGKPLPSDPERVAKCSEDVGRAVCQAGVCDPADDSCGLALGDGPCTDVDQCRQGHCNSETKLCQGGCTSNADCSSNEYCAVDGGVCHELLPVGAECEANNQCQTHDCTDNVCSSLIASGAGIACATRAPGVPVGSWGTLAFAALIGVAASARRRRATHRGRAA